MRLRTQFFKTSVACAVLLVAVAGCSLLRPGKKVTVSVEGDLDASIRSDLLQLASVQDTLTDDATNVELLRLVIAADEQSMQTYLRAQGYFDATVSGALPPGRKRRAIDFKIIPGPRYLMTGIDVEWPDDYTGPRPSPPGSGTDTGASFAAILNQSRDITGELREQGYAQAKLSQKEITVDHATRRVHPVFTAQPGSFMQFGRVDVDGLNTLRKSYIRKATPWKPGEPYRISKIREFESRLAASGLFSSINIQRAPQTEPPTTSPPDADPSRYDVKLSLRERNARTVQAGVGYRTDTGAEASAQWQHRNIAGGGEHFVMRGKITEIGYEAETRLTVPFFRRADQDWGTSFKITSEDSDAYDSTAYEASSWLSRQINRRLNLRTGVALHYLDEAQLNERDYYLLASLPASALWDDTDDRLDATRGYRAYFKTEPFQSIKDRDPFFWKNLLTLHGFVPLRKERLVLALRLTGGNITGASTRDIPAESRLYAGGGQSVRGYAYQSLSPRVDGEIVGGQSLLESSIELRARITGTMGAVVFLDGGAAYADTTPAGDESYRWGAGGGFRYYTPVGPLRLDVGFPLNRRSGVDDDWQVYVSIGQAF